MSRRPVSTLDRVVQEIADEMRRRPDRGKVASYIPELAGVDPAAFGLVVVDAEGHVAAPATRSAVLDPERLEGLHPHARARQGRRPAVEPRRPRASGSPFNSIVQLESERGIPRNPFINAGAIAVTDLILSGHQPREALGEILWFMRFLADDPSIRIDEAVAASEQRTGYRNARSPTT